MWRTENRDNGFSTLTILLGVLVIVAIAAVGVVAYQRISSKSNDTASTDQPSNQQPSNANTSTQPQPTAYLTIKEWGVRAPYSGTLNLSYTIPANYTSGEASATFSSDQLTALSTSCTGYGGWIIRWAANTQYSEGTPDASTPTTAAYFQGKDPITYNYAHIGNYYYTFAHAQSACGDPGKTFTLEQQTNDAVKALVANLQPITN